MTKSQLVQKLADAAGLTKKQADAVLQELVGMTVTTVRKGDPVKIPGLGTFRKVQTKARMGRNPQTGAAIKIPARKKVRFSVAKTFKEAVLGAKK
jgi:DNA-binding protein HU-beta